VTDVDPLSRRSFLGGLAASGVALTLRVPALAARVGAEAPIWMQLNPAVSPPARSDHGLAFDPVSELVYMFGGRRDGSPLNDLWTFDIATNTWTEIEPTGERPPERFTPICAFDTGRNRFMVSTGQGDDFYGDVWAFDVTSNTWEELGQGSADRPKRRYGAGGAYDPAGDRLLVTHGFTVQGRFDDTWVFDIGDGSWARIETNDDLPIRRCLTQGAWDPGSGKLLMFGGQTDNDPYLGDLWALNVDGGRWRRRRGRPKPSPRNFYGAAFDGAARRWFVYGGETDDGVIGDLWAYDAASKTWARYGSRAGRPTKRSSPGIVVANDRLLLFGGYAGEDLSDTWTISLD
jgi:hypothetical protein